jgi:hypothetical protein
MNHVSSSHSHHMASSSGWATFAGYLMIVAGVFQIMAGLVALFKSDLYVASANQLFIFDYSQWGWVHIAIGSILALSAYSLFAGRMFGRVVAITIATLSALANFAFIWAYPAWSIMIIVMDVLIIYGVAMGNNDNSVEE